MTTHGLLVTTQDPPSGEHIAERWQELLDVVGHAEASGFASFHVPEHHARDDAYLPQPLVACAALAARSSRIQIGTALSVAPLRHPLHLAEEAAVVDVISQGRLVLALGIGNYRPEFDLFGVPFEEQGSRFDEILSILLPALAGERLDHTGTHWTIRDARVTPRTVQRPRPPVWIGAMTQRGARRAADFGLPLLLDPLTSIGDLEPLVAYYRERASAAGHEPRVVLMRWAWLEHAADAREVWWPHVRPALWSYLFEIPRISAAATGGAAARSADDLDLDAVAPDRLLVGDAATVRSRVREWSERLGAERVIVKFQGASGPWGDDLADVIAAYGRDVIASGQP